MKMFTGVIAILPFLQ